MTGKIRRAIGRVLGFIGRQKRNYRIGMTRAAASSFLAGLASQYHSIFAVGLGANSVQWGSLNSISSAMSTLISVPIGWLVDRKGVRPFFLLSIGLAGASAMVYALARDWRLLILTAIFTSISTRLSGPSSSVICADSVQNKDRATAQNVCGTLSALVALLAPLIAAYLVTSFGGMNTEGIRPLFYLQAAGYAIVLLFVAANLREPQFQRQEKTSGSRGFISDFRQLFTGRPALRRWVIISALSGLPMAMF